MAGKTQLRGAALPTRRFGSFAGKVEQAVPKTQLRGAGIPGRRYGSFAGKTATEVESVVHNLPIQVAMGRLRSF